MKINDLSARVNAHEPLIRSAVDRVIASGWFVLGPEVRTFEAAFAEFLGAPHCIGTANGTDAIEIALKAMGVGPGDRVATVANAGMYTTMAILAIGAEPFYIDVDLSTCNTTLKDVEGAVSARVKAVVVTHLYGLAVTEIRDIAHSCKRQGVKLLEDCAQAHGAIVDGQRVGTFGDASSFSFYPSKNLGALGDGGAVVTRDDTLADKALRLRQYGWTDKYTVDIAGGRNSRLDELQAAILSALLPGLDASNARRRQIADRYGAMIHHTEVETLSSLGPDYVGHLYVVRSARRDALRQHLRGLGIASEVHYPIPDHRQPVFKERFSHIQLLNTEQLADEILTLPCYPEMTDAQLDQVIDGVNTWQS